MAFCENSLNRARLYVCHLCDKGACPIDDLGQLFPGGIETELGINYIEIVHEARLGAINERTCSL